MKESELIASKYSRDDSERYFQRNMPDIMFRKNFNHEPLRWTCPACGIDNMIKGWTGYAGRYSMMTPIITPRVYSCHNSRCQLRRFYWRDSGNNLYARYVGKYELIDELEFKSEHDPIKFYADLKLIDPKQTSMF